MAKLESATFEVTVRYNPKKTDPESLATALDRLMETATSIPGVLDDYGDPKVGVFFVLGATNKLDCIVRLQDDSDLSKPRLPFRISTEGYGVAVQALSDHNEPLAESLLDYHGNHLQVIAYAPHQDDPVQVTRICDDVEKARKEKQVAGDDEC